MVERSIYLAVDTLFDANTGLSDDERNIRWTRELHTALQPWVEDAVYVNDLGEDESARVRSAYGANFDRLVAVKAKYDPDNFTRTYGL